jgi:large subunit ribosomal protein L33
MVKWGLANPPVPIRHSPVPLFSKTVETAANIPMPREYVWLECTECSSRNYRTPKEMRGTERLELKKFCRKERRHTVHKESRKK